MPAHLGRAQRYVGIETPELLERIERHKEIRNDERERSALVSALLRLGMPRPTPETGSVIAALASAGIFRLRSVLVGTVAYQTYSSMLGEKLPAQSLRTDDIDIAQFKNVSVAVDEQIPPILEVLKGVNSTFRPIPHIVDGRRVTSYQVEGGLRVEFLTPNEGPDTDKPQRLQSLQTDAQPLRFLDFLYTNPNRLWCFIRPAYTSTYRRLSDTRYTSSLFRNGDVRGQLNEIKTSSRQTHCWSF